MPRKKRLKKWQYFTNDTRASKKNYRKRFNPRLSVDWYGMSYETMNEEFPVGSVYYTNRYRTPPRIGEWELIDKAFLSEIAYRRIK